MKILRVHYNFDLTGGAENDVLKLLRVFEEHKVFSTLLLIQRVKGGYEIKDSLALKSEKIDDLTSLEIFIKNYVTENNYNIIHIHSLPYKEIIDVFFKLNIPVYKSMHEAMMICPGTGKFWLTDELPCTIPFGIHCFMHAYTKKCTKSRMPSHLLDVYNYVYYEINTASRKYQKIFVYSSYMAESAIKAGIPKEKIFKIPSPQFVDEEEVDNSNYDDLPLDLLFVGRMSPQKGLHFLIRAIHILADKWPGITLKVIGDGQDKSYFIELVKKLNLEKQVQFIGWLNRKELADYYRSTRVVVIPSIYPDNFPNVVAEAMLFARPVVTFDVGGTAEWYEDNISGIKVANKNIELLAEKIDFILSNPDVAIKMGINARNEINMKHNPELTYQKYMEYYS